MNNKQPTTKGKRGSPAMPAPLPMMKSLTELVSDYIKPR